jgi:hypothetical protein
MIGSSKMLDRSDVVKLVKEQKKAEALNRVAKSLAKAGFF